MNEKQLARAEHFMGKARAYAAGVMDGSILACRWVKLAVERDERDRVDGHERGLYFDEYEAARVLVFISYLQHYKGEWRGKFIELEPWQCWVISVVFGWMRSNGRRRYRQIYEEVPRKNGKTIKLAAVGGWGLLKDDEGAPEIYAAATKKDQAKLLWKDARKMLGYSKLVKKRLRITDSKSLIEYPDGDGLFEPLGRDSNTSDGLNPHYALVDELHAHKTREIHDILVSGQGARSQPLLWEITTAGFTNNREQSICLEQREYTINVLEGVYQDDEHFGIIYTLDDWEAEWKNPAMWGKANPNLEYQDGTDDLGRPIMRGSVKHDYLQGQVTKAINSPSARVSVMTKNFNIWMSNTITWCNPDAWDACQSEFDLSDLTNAVKVWAGMDLASVSDLNSLALLAEMPDGDFYLWQRSWIPEERVQEAVQTRGVPYPQWVESGHLVATPGNVMDIDFIRKDLLGEDWEQNQVSAGGILHGLPLPEHVGIDRWMAADISSKLVDAGLPVVGYGMGYQSMNPAMTTLERLYLAGRLRHNGDPVFAWAMSNVVAIADPNMNVKPDKKKSSEKIDPAVAAMIAVGVSLGEGSAVDSAYEDEVYI